MAYVKEHHTTGVTWNPRGVTVAEYQAGGGAAAAAAAVAGERNCSSRYQIL
jgi:adenylyl cyclase-associated protein